MSLISGLNVFDAYKKVRSVCKSDVIVQLINHINRK